MTHFKDYVSHDKHHSERDKEIEMEKTFSPSMFIFCTYIHKNLFKARSSLQFISSPSIYWIITNSHNSSQWSSITALILLHLLSALYKNLYYILWSKYKLSREGLLIRGFLKVFTDGWHCFTTWWIWELQSVKLLHFWWRSAKRRIGGGPLVPQGRSQIRTQAAVAVAVTVG